MPMVEIDEAELLSMKRNHAAVTKMLAHPQARKLALQSQKLAMPEVPIPELDAAAPVTEEISKVQEETKKLADMIAADKAEREKDKQIAEFTASMEAKKTKLRKEGWTDEGIDGVMKLAEERGSADLEAMAALFDRLHPPAEIVQPGAGYGLNAMFETGSSDAEEMAALFNTKGEDPNALNALIGKGLEDARGGRR